MRRWPKSYTAYSQAMKDRLKSHKLTGPGLYTAVLCLIARIADILDNAGQSTKGLHVQQTLLQALRILLLDSMFLFLLTGRYNIHFVKFSGLVGWIETLSCLMEPSYGVSWPLEYTMSALRSVTTVRFSSRMTTYDNMIGQFSPAVNMKCSHVRQCY